MSNHLRVFIFLFVFFVVVRKLQEFEAPYLTLKVSEGKHRIAVRKS